MGMRPVLDMGMRPELDMGMRPELDTGMCVISSPNRRNPHGDVPCPRGRKKPPRRDPSSSYTRHPSHHALGPRQAVRVENDYNPSGHIINTFQKVQKPFMYVGMHFHKNKGNKL